MYAPFPAATTTSRPLTGAPWRVSWAPSPARSPRTRAAVSRARSAREHMTGSASPADGAPMASTWPTTNLFPKRPPSSLSVPNALWPVNRYFPSALTSTSEGSPAHRDGSGQPKFFAASLPRVPSADRSNTWATLFHRQIGPRSSRQPRPANYDEVSSIDRGGQAALRADTHSRVWLCVDVAARRWSANPEATAQGDTSAPRVLTEWVATRPPSSLTLLRNSWPKQCS